MEATPALTPRELVFRTLRFQSTPRVPRNPWTLPWAEIHYPAELAALRRDWPDDFDEPKVAYPPVRAMRGDPHAVGTFVDEWGCTFENLQAGVIGEVKDPLIESYESDLDKIRPPREWLQVNLDDVNEQCANSDRFMLAGCGIRPFERMQFLRGTTHLFMDLLDQPAGLFKLRERVHEWNLAMLDRWLKTDVDGVSWMDDWGSQRALLMAPALWREFYKPLYREYVDRIHAAGKFCLVHSDGYIFDIYEDLIEIGVDAINSQLFCMDIEEIGRRFKGRITFWGEIDRQHILPSGTVDDVRRAVRRAASALYDGRGGVIAECEFGAGAKPDNVRAVYEEWDRISRRNQ